MVMRARLRGAHAAELSPPDPNSIFRRLMADWDAYVARVDTAIQEQRRLAGLPHNTLARAALRARDAVPCRWGPEDLVYDGSIHHTVIPKLARRVAARNYVRTTDPPERILNPPLRPPRPLPTWAQTEYRLAMEDALR